MLIKPLGRVDYAATFDAMKAFTAARGEATPDELWLCEHPPTFTQGLAGATHHVLAAGSIPVVETDRGGQVTYHGPGQVVAYPLIDLKRRGYFVKEYVYRLEESVVRTLMQLGVTGHRVAGAPGIYVRLDAPSSHALLPNRPQGRHVGTQPAHAGPGLDFEGLGKIAALGIKVSRHCTYHGAALNVAMDLEPFRRINPCGYQGLTTVDLFTMGICVSPDEVAELWSRELQRLLQP
jgi:lipoyl(octanoyl) transferase